MTDTRLVDRHCLITGGSRGLGLAFAKAFVQAGAQVAFTYSTHDEDAEAAVIALRELGAEPLVFKGEVDDPAHARAVVKAIVAEWGGLDVLVNNAGINQILPFALLRPDDWDRMMSVNAKGPYLFSHAALRVMIRKKRGHILMVGNFSSNRVIEAPVHYAASKGALRGLTEGLAFEVGRYGISVNLIGPGLMDAGMGRTLPAHHRERFIERCPLNRLVTPEEVAEMAVFIVSQEPGFISGAKIAVDGGV